VRALYPSLHRPGLPALPSRLGERKSGEPAAATLAPQTEKRSPMLIDVIMPQLGESVSEGTITKWLVREGDIVKKDQPLLEIATDKADSELPAPAGGRVAKLLAKEGDVV